MTTAGTPSPSSGVQEVQRLDEAPVAEDGGDGPDAAGHAPGTDRRARRGVGRVLLALVTLALLAGLVVGALSLRAANVRDAERDELLATGRQAAVAFTSYDHADLDASFEAVLALATDSFREQFRVASDQLRPIITEKQAAARGEVLAAAIERYDAEEDTAVVMVAVDSTVTNTDVPAGAVQRFRLRLNLERAGDQWRVDEITPVV